MVCVLQHRGTPLDRSTDSDYLLLAFLLEIQAGTVRAVRIPVFDQIGETPKKLLLAVYVESQKRNTKSSLYSSRICCTLSGSSQNACNPQLGSGVMSGEEIISGI